MKRLYLIVGLTLCVVCVTAAKKTKPKALPPMQQLQQSLVATSSLIRAMTIFVPAEKESTKKYMGVASDLLLDGAFVVSQTQSIINDFKKLKGKAQIINNQGKCFIQNNKAITCTTQLNCKTQEECAAALLNSINELLLPIVNDILGTVEVTKGSDGQTKKSIKPGLLMGLANSQAIPQSYRLEWRDLLGKYTIKIVEAIEYLPKLGSMIKPPVKRPNEPKDVQSFREEPVVFAHEDVFSLD